MVEPVDDTRTTLDWSSLEERWSDLFAAHINPWGAAITFGLRSTRPEEPSTMTIRMRMGLQQAKVLGLILLRDIRVFEERTGTEVGLPAQMLEELGIPKEDWGKVQGSIAGGWMASRPPRGSWGAYPVV